MELFDFINCLSDKKKYKDIPDSEKRKHFFMVNRFMSIKYPMAADNFNMLKINKETVMDLWHKLLVSKYNRTPKWLYTKVEKAADKSIKMKSSLQDIKTFIVKNNMSHKDFDDMCDIFGIKEVDKMVVEFMKNINGDNISVKRKKK